MNIQIDVGVDMAGLDPVIWRHADDMAKVFATEGVPMVITSAKRPLKSGNTRFSFHWVGRALDLRGRHLNGETARTRVFEKLKVLLGPDYDVTMYDLSKGGHYHVEYDPK